MKFIFSYVKKTKLKTVLKIYKAILQKFNKLSIFLK